MLLKKTKCCLLNLTCRSANVLLSLDWRAALTDLGVAQVMEHTARTAVGGSNLYAGGWGGLGQQRWAVICGAHVQLSHVQLAGVDVTVWACMT